MQAEFSTCVLSIQVVVRSKCLPFSVNQLIVVKIWLGLQEVICVTPHCNQCLDEGFDIWMRLNGFCNFLSDFETQNAQNTFFTLIWWRRKHQYSKLASHLNFIWRILLVVQALNCLQINFNYSFQRSCLVQSQMFLCVHRFLVCCTVSGDFASTSFKREDSLRTVGALNYQTHSALMLDGTTWPTNIFFFAISCFSMLLLLYCR